MTVRERVRWILERVVIHLWLCAALLGLLKLAGPSASPSPTTQASTLPAQCQVPGSEDGCNATPERGMLRLATVPQATYLATCSANPPCHSPFLAAQGPATPLRQELERIAGLCPGAPSPRHLQARPDAGPPDCSARQDALPELFVLPESSLTPALAVLAGPFDSDGNPLAASARAPMLTLLPAVDLDAALERLLRLSERFPGVPDRLAAWNGMAGHGWLVFPLTGFFAEPENFANAIQLLGRIARAVVPPPRPSPVIVDLAGLTPCPTSDEMRRLVQALASLGFVSIGHTLDGAAPSVQFLEGQVLRGRVFSARVTPATAACPTTVSVAPSDLLGWLASHTADSPAGADLTVLLVHWRDPSLPVGTRESLVQELLSSGVSVVAGIGGSNPGPIVDSSIGLGLLDVGSLMSSKGILPGAVGASGLALQCYRSDSGTHACRTTPVAPSLGIGAPVETSACKACGLLPFDYVDTLYGAADRR